MIVPGSSYWNFAIGLEKGDVDKDQEGIQTMQVLGQNMALAAEEAVQISQVNGWPEEQPPSLDLGELSERLLPNLLRLSGFAVPIIHSCQRRVPALAC
jgi:hypothetical protein